MPMRRRGSILCALVLCAACTSESPDRIAFVDDAPVAVAPDAIVASELNVSEFDDKALVEFPEASRRALEDGLRLSDVGMAICAQMQVFDNPDELTVRLMTEEPDGVFSDGEPYSAFVDMAGSSLCFERWDLARQTRAE